MQLDKAYFETGVVVHDYSQFESGPNPAGAQDYNGRPPCGSGFGWIRMPLTPRRYTNPLVVWDIVSKLHYGEGNTRLKEVFLPDV